MTILLAQPFLILFGVILLMVIFKSRFHSVTEFLNRLRKSDQRQRSEV